MAQKGSPAVKKNDPHPSAHIQRRPSFMRLCVSINPRARPQWPSLNEFIAFVPIRCKEQGGPQSSPAPPIVFGPRDSAQVALQRCPILRPGHQHYSTNHQGLSTPPQTRHGFLSEAPNTNGPLLHIRSKYPHARPAKGTTQTREPTAGKTSNPRLTQGQKNNIIL